MVVVGETREKLEAACGLQGVEDLRIEPREDDGIVSVSGTSTDLLKISRLCINVAKMSLHLASGYDPGSAVMLHERSPSVSDLKGCAFRGEGFGDDLSVKPYRFLFTSNTQHNHIDLSPTTLTTSTTSSAESLPDKVPGPPPVQVAPPVHLDLVVRSSPHHQSGCFSQNASRGSCPPVSKSLWAKAYFAGVLAYQAGTAPFTASGTGAPDSGPESTERIRFPASFTCLLYTSPSPRDS